MKSPVCFPCVSSRIPGRFSLVISCCSLVTLRADTAKNVMLFSQQSYRDKMPQFVFEKNGMAKLSRDYQ